MLLGRNEDFRPPQASIGGQTCPLPFDVVQPPAIVVMHSRTKSGLFISPNSPIAYLST